MEFFFLKTIEKNVYQKKIQLLKVLIQLFHKIQKLIIQMLILIQKNFQKAWSMLLSLALKTVIK